MLEALTFDVGGTLDAPGVAWRPRFEPLYRQAGVLGPGAASDEAFRRAFFDADDHLHERHALAGRSFAETVRFQVEDVLANLGRQGEGSLAARIADAFVAESRASFRRARPVLEALARRYRLGIVSNFYGNLRSTLASEDMLGAFVPRAVIDSRELGAEKPDARIFEAACRGLGVAPERVAHVGDSWPRDVVGALGAGLSAVWLGPGQPAPADSRVLHVQALEEIEGALAKAASTRVLAASPSVFAGAPSVFAGILAAGHGARFAAAGERTPKALVRVAGRSLLARSLDAFAAAGHAKVTVVTNDAVAPAVRQHLAGTRLAAEVELVVKTTASTLETFEVLLGLAEKAGSPRFAFTTVDAITAPGELGRFSREAARSSSDLVLGVAPIEPGDEGPLRVELDGSGRATLGRGTFATAGYYAGRTAAIAPRARAARASGVPSLRAFLTSESGGSVVDGIVLARAVDVDTPADVVLAERALGEPTGSHS